MANSITPCLALMALLLAIAAQARPLPAENSRNKLMMIIMTNNIWKNSKEIIIRENDIDEYYDSMAESSMEAGKVTPSPPSPRSSPSTRQATKDMDENMMSSSSSSSSSIILSLPLPRAPKPATPDVQLSMFGKTPKKSPPPPPKAAPSQHQGMIEQPYNMINTSSDLGKTPKSPPSPKAAPSKHQGIIEQPQDFRNNIASS